MVSLDPVFVSSTLTNAAENRQHLFDNDVLHSFLTRIDKLNDTECLLFSSFLVNQYGTRVQDRQSDCGTLKSTGYLPNEFFTLLTSKLCENKKDREVRHSRDNILLVLRDTIDSGKFQWEIDGVTYNNCADGLRKRLWNSEMVKGLRQAFNQVGPPVWSQVLELYRTCIIYSTSYSRS